MSQRPYLLFCFVVSSSFCYAMTNDPAACKQFIETALAQKRPISQLYVNKKYNFYVEDGEDGKAQVEASVTHTDGTKRYFSTIFHKNKKRNWYSDSKETFEMLENCALQLKPEETKAAS